MDLNAEFIANKIINAKFASDIFVDDINAVNKDYKRFIKIIHPDLNNGQEKFVKATQKLTELHEKAINLINNGKWDEKNACYFDLINGKRIKINYLKEIFFELGKSYIGKKSVFYFIENKNSKFFRKYRPENILNSGKWDKRLKNIQPLIENMFPKTTKVYSCKNGYLIIQQRKDGEIPLSLIKEYYNNKIPSEHVAWIISRLLNAECYMMATGYLYNGFDVNNIYIIPETHEVILHGGFWYTTNVGEKLFGVSSFVYNNMTENSKKKGISNCEDEFNCIKSIGRNLVGLKSKVSRVNCPKALTNYLFSSIKDYNQYSIMKEWENVLTNSFGEKKFVKMNINKNLLED